MQEAAGRFGGGRRSTWLEQDVAALGVQAGSGLYARVAPQHRGDVVALAALAPRHQVGADALAQRVVQVVAAERASAAQRVPRRLGDLLERIAGGKALVGRQPLDLPAELLAELVLVARDQRPSIEGVVLRRERVDRAAHDVRDDEFAAVGGLVVLLPRQTLQPRRHREQRRIAREVRGGARRRRGEVLRVAHGQPRAGQPKGEDLLRLHGSMAQRPPPSSPATTVAASAIRWSFVQGGPIVARGPSRISSARSTSLLTARASTSLAS